MAKIFGASTLGLIFLSPSVLALNASTYNILANPFYDPSEACTVNVPVSLSGDSNVQEAFNFFVSKGLSVNQSAGMVGNFMRESHLDPTIVQGTTSVPMHDSQDPNSAGNLGWGIAQWTPGSKALGIVRDANIKTPVYELGTQLEMIWAQLNGKAGGFSETQAGTDLKKTNTVEEATREFLDEFERGPAETEQTNYQIGLNFAKQILQKYGDSAGTSVTTTSSSGCSTTNPGQNTTYVNGFTVYSQYDPTWANKPYGDTTIAAAGCGPSAMAMIISTLTKQSITPDITASYAASHGLYISGAGSSWQIGPALAEHWALKSKAVSANTKDITAALQSGSLVIVAGRGPEPFTTVGHFIVIRAATSDGQWMVGDSAHPDANTKPWSPNLILASIVANGSSGSVYAISK